MQADLSGDCCAVQEHDTAHPGLLKAENSFHPHPRTIESGKSAIHKAHRFRRSFHKSECCIEQAVLADQARIHRSAHRIQPADHPYTSQANRRSTTRLWSDCAKQQRRDHLGANYALRSPLVCLVQIIALIAGPQVHPSADRKRRPH
ncbi:MAG TPA: hypothetical protein VF070_37840 [Streptosporangiaceae bacterium]